MDKLGSPQPDIAQQVMIQTVGNKLAALGITSTGFLESPDGLLRATLALGADSEEIAVNPLAIVNKLDLVRDMQDKFCAAIRALKNRTGATA